MPLQKRPKDSPYLPPRTGIPLPFHVLKELTQHLLRWSSSQLYGILYSQMYFTMSIDTNRGKANLLLNIRFLESKRKVVLFAPEISFYVPK